MSGSAIVIQGLIHRYGDHRALAGLEMEIQAGEIFGLLGPNGGGKTTLFRVLSTLLPVQAGSVTLLGFDVQTQPDAVRAAIGVTFQSPSLDIKLTVTENLKHQGHLYGLSGKPLQQKIDELLNELGLADRRNDRADSLSGGLKRRVEIAKGLLHNPKVLLLDEPSTGLDPGARHDLWRYLDSLQKEHGVTVFVTTHLMEEAEHCDRLGILDSGELVALGTPDELRATVGGDCLSIVCEDPDALSKSIEEKFQVKPQRLADSLRIEMTAGHEFLKDLVEAFPDEVKSVSLGKPTLEDVFIQRTGHRFWEGDEK